MLDSLKMSRGLLFLEAAKHAASDNLESVESEHLENCAYYCQNQEIFTRRGKKICKNVTKELQRRGNI